MEKYIAELHLLLEIELNEDVLAEVRLIHDLCYPGLATPLFDRCFSDTIRLFSGEYPGYQACTAEYHDLRHTLEVLVATSRMIHANLLDGRNITPQMAEFSLLAALMHDIGYIQRDDETGPAGQHTLAHVERSADFFAAYGRTLGLSPADTDRCCCMITATSLAIDPDTIRFPDEETAAAARLVAAADLIGQMADRIYLEKLLCLYQEFREAGLTVFTSELDLLTQTCGFYAMVRQRIDEKLGAPDRSMALHFRNRWDVDRDLYLESIALNLQFLDDLVCEHREDYRHKLKRGGIVERIMRTEATGTVRPAAPVPTLQQAQLPAD